MIPIAQAFRLAGFWLLALGAWERLDWLMAIGAVLIARGWLHGFLRRHQPGVRHTPHRL